MTVIATARAADHVAALELLFRHFPSEEALARMAVALPLLHDSARHNLNLLVARAGDSVAGAMLIQALPGGTGLVWPPQVTGADTALEDELLYAALDWLRERGARLAQALLTRDEVALAEPLRRHGFTNPGRLWHLRHDLDWPAELLTAPGPLAFQSLRDCNADAFQLTLLRTHRQTQDFPELNQICGLDGHAGEPDPDRSWLASAAGRPVGVLLLKLSDEPGEWELAYIGVVPEERHRGWGSELVRKALAEATSGLAGALTLSLDARNEPAWRLYRTWGFEPFSAREVFLKTI